MCSFKSSKSYLVDLFSKMSKLHYRPVWTAEARYDPSFLFATRSEQTGRTAEWPAGKTLLKPVEEFATLYSQIPRTSNNNE